MTLRNFQLAAISLSVFATSTLAQTSFPEVEPNANKAEATTNGTITLVAGDSITGTTTGTTATAASTLITSLDQFRVRTGALPLGIYRHELAITTTGTAGHVGTLRGLSQTNGVINTTSDSVFQTSSATIAPIRTNVWYGFGKQEELYYRVTGSATTTAPYVSTLATTTVTPVAVAGTFNAGSITVTSVGQGHTTDTEIYLYDGNLDPVPLGHNDDPAPSTAGPSTVTRPLTGGTYYVAISNFNLSNNISDLDPTETWDDFSLMDFPNVVANSSTATALNCAFSVSDGVTTTPVAVTKAGSFETVWATFTVVGILPPPANDNCASATAITSNVTNGTLGSATNDGAASCDPGGASSKDVWYSFTGGPFGGSLTLDTCGSIGIDTVLSVYSSCGGAELACSDNGAACGATLSTVTLALTANQTVLIRVSDKGLGGNNFQLNRTFVANPPANDSCATPTALGGPGTYVVTNQNATTGPEGQAETLCLAFGFTAVINDVWFTYTPTTNGTVTFATCGAVPVSVNEDSKIAIYAGAACPASGSAIACNDDNTCVSGGFESSVSFPATCGTTYLVQFGMYGGSTATAFYDGGLDVTETGGTSCATPITAYCFGDGTGTACPCANSGVAGNGCANGINPNGANLTATGIASIASDTWVLSATGVPNGPGLYFQGTTQLNGGNGNPFGDGLRCAGGAIIRLGIVTGVANASTYPSPNPPAVNAIPISVKGLNAAGNIRNYQLWYRDSTAGFCTANVFNLTNAVNMTWAP